MAPACAEISKRRTSPHCSNQACQAAPPLRACCRRPSSHSSASSASSSSWMSGSTSGSVSSRRRTFRSHAARRRRRGNQSEGSARSTTDSSASSSSQRSATASMCDTSCEVSLTPSSRRLTGGPPRGIPTSKRPDSAGGGDARATVTSRPVAESSSCGLSLPHCRTVALNAGVPQGAESKGAPSNFSKRRGSNGMRAPGLGALWNRRAVSTSGRATAHQAQAGSSGVESLGPAPHRRGCVRRAAKPVAAIVL
mmetsp:Transcript_88260/g.248488  ORF Transcript_88260/g.248488 Transcript_88260/m.248488 type:complete len:252 (-) Transcript_88260:56-811(-)